MIYTHPEGQKVDQYLFAPPSIFCQKYCRFWIQSISAYKVELFLLLLSFFKLSTQETRSFICMGQFNQTTGHPRLILGNGGPIGQLLYSWSTQTLYGTRSRLLTGPELTKQRKHFPVERQRSRIA